MILFFCYLNVHLLLQLKGEKQHEPSVYSWTLYTLMNPQHYGRIVDCYHQSSSRLQWDSWGETCFFPKNRWNTPFSSRTWSMSSVSLMYLHFSVCCSISVDRGWVAVIHFILSPTPVQRHLELFKPPYLQNFPWRNNIIYLKLV